MRHKALTFLIFSCFCKATWTYAIPTIVVLAAGLSSKAIYCRFKECCRERWIPENLTNLKADLKKKVFGQHIAIEVVYKVIAGHIKNKNPEKPLVLSFNGWTGCGKNHVSKIIADNLYKLGSHSKYVKEIIATKDFPHQHKVSEYKDKLRRFIVETVKKCPRSLFIFDEVDKAPLGLIDALRPFLDHYREVDGVDYRKSIFLFLSNAGASLINKFVFDHWRQGKKREDMTIKELDHIVNNEAFNDKGGFWHCDLIKHNLIDYFVPFLPLEKSHVKQCIRVELSSNEKLTTDEEDFVNRVANELQYYDPDKIFSKSGCKKVASKVYLLKPDEKDHE